MRSLRAAILIVLALTPRAAQGLTRCEVIARAQTWVDEQVPYSQATLHSNSCGSYRQDCSGFVSMAWELDKSYVCITLPQVSVELGSFADLKPGDAVNKTCCHVMLFKEWVDPGVSFKAYEQQTWGTVTGIFTYTVSWAKGQGYRPYRLDGIQPCCSAGCDGSRVVGQSCNVVEDCAASGGVCTEDALGARCVSPRCPATGSQQICLDDDTLGQCHDGQLSSEASCAGGSFCSTAGGEARCVSSSCVAVAADFVAHQVCLPDGQLASCTAEGALLAGQPCPARQLCVTNGAGATCAAMPSDTSATPATPEPHQTSTITQGSGLGSGSFSGGGADMIGGCAVWPAGGASPPAGLAFVLVLLLICRRRHRTDHANYR